MDRSGLSRLIPIILVIIVVIVAVAALISVGRTLFSGGGEEASPSPAVNKGKEELTNTSAGHSVQTIVRGPITANETFRSYTITVAPDSRNMTTYQGYVGKEIDNEQLENNTDAYTQFVNALSRAHMMDGTPFTGDANNINGICATGYVYEFAVMQGTNTIQKLWTSTCRGSKGSLLANQAQISHLFQVQIPDFYTLVNKAKIGS